MHKLLIIDDEEPIRRLIRINLEGRYKIVDTGDPALALEAVLQGKPNAILLDLRMPNFSGFELCRTFKSMSITQRIPVIVISGEAGANTKQFCEELGAAAYFEKPIDFEALRDGLERILADSHPERRSEVRVALRVILNLRGNDRIGKPFEEMCPTEQISRSSFFCTCKALLKERSEVAVSLVSGSQKFLGMANVVRCDPGNGFQSRYAFRFVQRDINWILQ